MSPAHAKKLGLRTWKTNVGAQKINGSALETFEMVIADFQVEDKSGRPKFFQETFLVADTKFEIILGMLFLKLNNADVSFGEEILTWNSYTTSKTLPTTKQVQLVDPKEFVIAVLEPDNETFVVHMIIQEQKEMAINPDKKAQIKAQSEAKSGTQIQNKAQVKVLLFDEAPTEVPTEYSNNSNVFSVENIAELPENTGMNKHAIELEEDKQPPFGPIYSLGPM